MYTKDPKKGTFKIIVQATKPGELWCYYPKKTPSLREDSTWHRSPRVKQLCWASLSREFLNTRPVVSHSDKSPSGLLRWVTMSWVQRGHITGFDFIISPISLYGWRGPFCSKQKTSDVKKGPLLHNHILALHCSSVGWSGCDSQAPKGSGPKRQAQSLGARALGIQFPRQYLATMCVRGSTYSDAGVSS